MLREPQASDIIYCILCICFLVVVVYIFLPFKIRGIFTYTPDYHIFRFTTNHKPPAKSTPCEWDMQEHGRWSWSNWRPPSYPLRALVQSVEAWRVFTAVKNLDEWMPKLMGQKESIGTLSGFKKLVASVCVCFFFFSGINSLNFQGRKYVLPRFFVQLARMSIQLEPLQDQILRQKLVNPTRFRMRINWFNWDDRVMFCFQDKRKKDVASF